MRLAFKWRSLRGGSSADRRRSELVEAETIWQDPEKKDPISLAQSLTMKQSIGVPRTKLWEEAGYSPTEIEQMEQEYQEQLEADQKNQLKVMTEQAKIQATVAPKPARNGGDPQKAGARS
jgi:hypothetical protein